MRTFKRVRSDMLGLLLATALSSVNALPAFATEQHQFNVPATEAPAAIRNFAAQANVQILVAGENVEGKTLNAVSGELSTEEGLRILLADSGLAPQYVGNRSIALVPAESLTSQRMLLEQIQVAKAESEAEQGASSAENGKLNSQNDTSTVKLDEIVVTAQKREERLQDVPIAISVLSGEDLDKSRAQGVTEALNRIPGVTATTDVHGNGTQIAMRGVAPGAPFNAGVSVIGYYLDAVPFAGPSNMALVPDASAFDLERVEVLRGPQGTLYGVNAVNGLVRVLTHDADLNAFDFKARTSASTTDGGGENYRGDIAANVPLVEGKLAARAVVGYQDLSGWIESAGESNRNDAELRNYRLKVNAQPTENLSLGLSMWSTRNDLGAASVADDDGRVSTAEREPIYVDYDIYGLEVNYDSSYVSVSSATSYIDYGTGWYLDLIPFNVPTMYFTGPGAEIFSEEIVLNSTNSNSWKWSVGAIYIDSQTSLAFALPDIPGLFPARADTEAQSYAVFANLGRRFFNNQLEWSVGMRHFSEESSSTGVDLLGQPVPQTPLFTSQATTPRAALTWYASDDVTFYASYGEGFRAGGPAPTIAPQLGELEPDKLRSYEIGTKAALLDDRLSLEAAFYYIEWEKVHQTLTVPYQPSPDVDPIPVSALVNSATASGAGIDVALVARAAERLDLGLSLSWNDLSFDDPVFSNGEIFFEKGDRLNYSSEYTGSAFGEYTFPLGSGGFEGQLSASATYSSKQTATGLAAARYVNIGDPLLIVRTGFAVTSPDHWTATLFVDNLGNEDGATPPQDLVPEWAARLRPRTIGVQLDYRFGR